MKKDKGYKVGVKVVFKEGLVEGTAYDGFTFFTCMMDGDLTIKDNFGYFRLANGFAVSSEMLINKRKEVNMAEKKIAKPAEKKTVKPVDKKVKK
jgi:hypothetical protein